MRKPGRKLITTLLSVPLLAVSLLASASASALAVPRMAPASASGQHAAQVISASAGNWSAANSKIGPLQGQRLFYPGALPSRFAHSACNRLPAGDWCIVSYNKRNTNVASYVSSIPSSRNVVLVWEHEPEIPGRFSSGHTFVSGFDAQSALIRKAAHGAKNVHVASDSESWQYGFGGGNGGSRGAGCSFIPPASAVDYYYADNYSPTAQPLAGMVRWQNWLKCVKKSGKPIGIAEFGLGSCAGASARVKTLLADAAYLKTLDVQLWSYYYVPNKGCENWQFTDSAMISAWRGIEAGK